MHMAFFNDIIILDERKDRNLKNVTFLARIFPPCPPFHGAGVQKTRGHGGHGFWGVEYQKLFATSTMCWALRPNCFSRAAAGPEWPNSS